MLLAICSTTASVLAISQHVNEECVLNLTAAGGPHEGGGGARSAAQGDPFQHGQPWAGCVPIDGNDACATCAQFTLRSQHKGHVCPVHIKIAYRTKVQRRESISSAREKRKPIRLHRRSNNG